MLKIWGRKNSINVQKVMWTVGELGLSPERIDAGMAHGIVGEPWYATYNPNRLVPTIDDDGVVLWESNVIVRYLAAKHAPGTLMPTDPVARAKAEMWMDWQQNTRHAGRPEPVVPRPDPHAARQARCGGTPQGGRGRPKAALRMLDAHLAKQAYVLAATA